MGATPGHKRNGAEPLEQLSNCVREKSRVSPCFEGVIREAHSAEGLNAQLRRKLRERQHRNVGKILLQELAQVTADLGVRQDDRADARLHHRMQRASDRTQETS